MQSIINLSKYLLLVVLSFSFLIVWYSTSSNDVLEFENTIPIESSVNNQNSDTAPNLDLIPITSSISSANSIWYSISRDLIINHKTQSAAVQKEIKSVLAEKGKLESILKAAAPYIYYIHQQTQKYNLPGELALIPVIESEFNPNDHSTKGATGLWQLMPATARDLGIKVKSSYDGRRNVIDSTKGALLYFRDLGNNFKGNWYLAIAAYNCGQQTVANAIRRAGSHDFSQLHLPTETKFYVLKLLAIAAIVNNPQKYGVQLPAIYNKPYFSQIETSKPFQLSAIAKEAGINLDTLNKLNPDYKNGKIPKKGPYTLLVPINKKAIVISQLGKSGNSIILTH